MCIRGMPLSVVGDKILDETFLRSTFGLPRDRSAISTDPHDKCLCIRLAYRVALDLALIEEAGDKNRLDVKSLALVEVAEQLRDRFSNCTPDRICPA